MIKPIILVVPFGEVDSSVLAHIGQAVQETFNRECRMGKAMPVPDFALNARRGQFSAEEILSCLEPGGAERVLGVADLDLYVPDLNFVFGLADLSSGRALIGIPRLRQEFYSLPGNNELFLERVVKEAAHELGHTFGLEHCSNRRCVMTFSNSLSDTDFKSHTFCQKCQRRLGS